MIYSPIVVFGFNRPDALKNTIASLLRNEEAKDSDLFVFVDGPRDEKVGEKEKVKKVREYVKSITGFKSLHYTFAENNKGLANSIIGGVSEVINQYGRVIILEDDIVLSNNFLSFLNQALVFYQNNNQVFSVCGESIRIKVPTDYTSDIYFAPRSGCWGWATWADRWNSVDWELKDWKTVKKNMCHFNKWGGSDCSGMLKDWHMGKNSSWAIRFCYSQFIQNKLSVFPVLSKISNDGFDGEGTHCKKIKHNKFKMDFDQTNRKEFCFLSEIQSIPFIVKQRLWPVQLHVRIIYKILNFLGL